MKYVTWLALAGLGLSTVPMAAQQVTLGGQVRPRFEFRDPAGAGDDGFTSMRARASLRAALERDVTVFVQVQDVRLFGEEANTLGDFRADNFDVHQAWVEIGNLWDSELTARIGRQELNLGEQRLVGAVNWTQQGRAFDGVRLTYRSGNATVDGFGFKTGEATAPTVANDGEFAGVNLSLADVAGGEVQLYGFFRRQLLDPALDRDTKEGTFGVRYAARRNQLMYRFEGAYQLGDRGGADVRAFMLTANVGAELSDRATVLAWYDYLSGDEDLADGTTRVFNTLFATNHLFYGLADLFLDIPTQTAGRGLQDIAVKGRFRAADDLMVGLDVHEFLAARQGTLSTRRLGEEFDLTISHPYTDNVTFQVGASYIIQGDGFAEIGRLGEDMTWVYVMINARM